MPLSKITSFSKTLSKKVGIDLGTANSLVYLEGKGIVLKEPSVVAVSLKDRRVVAVGNQAKEMLGRTPVNIIASKPMKDGVIADYVVTEAMLRYFLQKSCGKTFLLKPEVMISVPAGSTQVERRAVEDATRSAGARAVYIIHEPLAAAIGAGIPIGEPSGNMVVDIGGGATEVAIISMGGVVVSRSLRIGGNKMDDAVISYLRKKQGIIIGDNSAERVKIEIGSALKVKKEKTIIVKGRDVLSGLPKKVKISTNQTVEAFERNLGLIVKTIKEVLEEAPPELASDIIDKGIVLTGGTPLLNNFDRLITKETGVPAFVAENPMQCVAKGIGVALESLEKYKRSFYKS
jgi:rod shape-determining protein MreB